MGEMADDFLDGIEEAEDLRWKHDHGQCDQDCPYCGENAEDGDERYE